MLAEALNKETPVHCGTARAPDGWTCIRRNGHSGPCAPMKLRSWRGLAADICRSTWRPALCWLMYTAAVVLFLWALHQGTLDRSAVGQ